MIIGVAKETFPGERRVALVPGELVALRKAGLEIVVERGAGLASGFDDAAYESAGGRLAEDRATVFGDCDVVMVVRGLGANPVLSEADLDLMRTDQAIMGFLEPLGAPQRIDEAARKGVTALAVELLPRITRAQAMDALSSQATVAGYRAMLLAAAALPRMFPMLMTAAGTITPAKVLVVGAGVAGLQAIAVARRLGSIVSAYDVRAAVKEQVESLGARFVELPVEATDAEAAGGYAREMDEDFYRRQRELMLQVVAESDVVVTTALVPGRPAPVLVTEEMIRGMRHGSVVVDLAAERGGNCELTRPGETVDVNGVKILGPTNLPAEVPYHASQMYARNLSSFLGHIVKDGALNLDMDDEIVRETLVARGGEVVHAGIREALGLTPISESQE